MEERLLRLPQVIEKTGIKTSTIYAKIKQKRFPSQRKYGGTACWFITEIMDWIKIGEEQYYQNILKKEQEKVS